MQLFATLSSTSPFKMTPHIKQNPTGNIAWVLLMKWLVILEVTASVLGAFLIQPETRLHFIDLQTNSKSFTDDNIFQISCPTKGLLASMSCSTFRKEHERTSSMRAIALEKSLPLELLGIICPQRGLYSCWLIYWLNKPSAKQNSCYIKGLYFNYSKRKKTKN